MTPSEVAAWLTELLALCVEREGVCLEEGCPREVTARWQARVQALTLAVTWIDRAAAEDRWTHRAGTRPKGEARRAH